jgi:hypothetical protein
MVHSPTSFLKIEISNKLFKRLWLACFIFTLSPIPFQRLPNPFWVNFEGWTFVNSNGPTFFRILKKLKLAIKTIQTIRACVFYVHVDSQLFCMRVYLFLSVFWRVGSSRIQWPKFFSPIQVPHFTRFNSLQYAIFFPNASGLILTPFKPKSSRVCKLDRSKIQWFIPPTSFLKIEIGS